MGAILAMRDGADLAQVLTEHATADGAVTAYEKILIPHAPSKRPREPPKESTAPSLPTAPSRPSPT
jgi:hypothetical protein